MFVRVHFITTDTFSGTMGKRLQNINVENTDDHRRKYREMLFSTDNAISNSISGVILFDETFRQSSAAGKPFTEVCYILITNIII